MDADQCQTVLVHLPNHSVVYDFFREVHLFYKPDTYIFINYHVHIWNCGEFLQYRRPYETTNAHTGQHDFDGNGML
ncbi:hypothetical protein OSTOST_25644 [Ostertagia ostertagi]